MRPNRFALGAAIGLLANRVPFDEGTTDADWEFGKAFRKKLVARGWIAPAWPKEYGGMGATAPEGVRVLRAVASRSPSLGIFCTMHNFSVSTLVEWAVFGEEYGEIILSSLAENSLYLASGFAEGRSGSKPLDMSMKARRAGG